MNIKDIENGLKEIEQEMGDSEVSHGIEDNLYYDFVRSLACGTFEGDIKEASSLLITSLDLDFSRWRA